MTELYASQYFKIFHEEENKLFYYIFTEKTADMTGEEYLDELKVFTNLVATHAPTRILGDMISFGFAITPDIQDWVTHNLFTVYEEVGMKKIAILLSAEFVAALSIEQTMDEKGSDSFVSRFFDNEQDARTWLMAD